MTESEKILDLFLNTKNNSETEIANKLKIPVHRVTVAINNYFKKI